MRRTVASLLALFVMVYSSAAIAIAVPTAGRGTFNEEVLRFAWSEYPEWISTDGGPLCCRTDQPAVVPLCCFPDQCLGDSGKAALGAGAWIIVRAVTRSASRKEIERGDRSYANAAGREQLLAKRHAQGDSAASPALRSGTVLLESRAETVIEGYEEN